MINKLVADSFFKRLEGLETGNLKVTTPDGHVRYFEGQRAGQDASIDLHDWRVVTNMMMHGDVGFARDYREGLWNSEDLVALTRLGLENRQAMDRMVSGHGLFRKLAKLSYMLRENTLSGSKKNIHAHYDLGNEFYKLWLDPTMTYSSAIFDRSEDLIEAQHSKYDRILDVLNAPSGKVLEVGCGWGGFADRAMQKGDYELKGITLSEEQHNYAQKRLGKKADIVLEDYRRQSGKYDHIVSIEMFEAVGERFWPVYFGKLKDLLADKGRAVVQTITMNEHDFDNYREGSDFIRSYIFPGGMLPSPSRFKQEAAKAGLKVKDTFAFGGDYALTLEIWLGRFDDKRDEVRQLGYDDGFIRLWRFYLAACAAGFHAGRTDVMQVELAHA